MKKQKSQKKEITWNIVNSLLAGGLVLLGSFSSGKITLESFTIALIASLAVALTQFKNYWNREEKEYCKSTKLFNFTNI